MIPDRFTVVVPGKRTDWWFRLGSSGLLDFDCEAPGGEQHPAGLCLTRLIADPNQDTARALWTAWGNTVLPDTEIWGNAASSPILGAETRQFLHIAAAFRQAVENSDTLLLAGILQQQALRSGQLKPLYRFLIRDVAAGILVSAAWGWWGQPVRINKPSGSGTVQELLLEALDHGQYQALPEEERPPALLRQALAGDGLTIPVVGLYYAEWPDKVLAPLIEAHQEAARSELFASGHTNGADRRLHSIIEGIPVQVLREPGNPYDSNAWKVAIGDHSGIRYKAGYLRRNLAALLCQCGIEPEQLRASLVRIHRESEPGADSGVVIRLQAMD